MRIHWKCLWKTVGAFAGAALTGAVIVFIIVLAQFWGYISIMVVILIILFIGAYRNCVDND